MREDNVASEDPIIAYFKVQVVLENYIFSLEISAGCCRFLDQMELIIFKILFKKVHGRITSKQDQ